MPRTDYHKRRVPAEVQGVVIDGIKLKPVMYVPLRDGMTKAKAEAFSEDLIERARKMVNYRVTDEDAYEFAVEICDRHKALVRERGRDGLTDLERTKFVDSKGFPCASGWLAEMGRTFSMEDQCMIARWVVRVDQQRRRLLYMRGLMSVDDPEALVGQPKVEARHQTPAQLVRSVRVLAGQTPTHSEMQRQYYEAAHRSFNYRRAFEQFRELVGDREIADYTADDCWTFRNWLNETKDEKKGEPLSGQTKNNKLSAISSMFQYAIEKRYRNDNPMRDVKFYPKNENRKKVRRLYTKDELKALFIDNRPPETEWQTWLPRLGLFQCLRITEALQLRPDDVSNLFGVWHIIVKPGRGQSVKNGKSRVVPLHKELIRLGFLDLVKKAKREKREWLFRDVPLCEKPGRKYNAPDADKITVPSQNAATQWFGRYSDDCKVTDKNLDFHGLRGAFITYGSQQGDDFGMRMEIAGHSKGDGVHGQYIYAGAPLKKLKAEIDKIKFPIRIP